MALHNATAAVAAHVFTHDFADKLRAKAADPAASIAKAGAVRYIGATQALVRAQRGLQLYTSSVPLRAKPVSSAKPAPVSLRLRRVHGWLLASNPLQPVSIASNLAGGVQVGSGGIQITPLGANVPATVLDGSQVAYFRNVATDEDVSVAPTIAGVDLAAILRSRLSPDAVAYRVTLPSGTLLHAHAGGAAIMREGSAIARIQPPVAWDAQHTAIPTTMSVVGDELIVKTPHSNSAIAYPIMVDPEVVVITESSEGWSSSVEGAGEATPPGGGSPLRVTANGTFPPTEPCFAGEGTCGNFRITNTLTWSHATPLQPNTVATRISAELQDVSFAASTPGEHPEDAHWYTVMHCGTHEHEHVVAGASGAANNSPPTTLLLSGSGCTAGSARHTEVALEVGQNEPFFVGEAVPQVSPEASISVGAILEKEELDLPEEAGSEQYGSSNDAEPGRKYCLAGETVNCATGNRVITETDLEVGGRGPGLDLTRTYNSRLAAAEITAASAGPFGFGWTASYSAHLALGGGVAVVRQDNGSTVSYLETSGAFTATNPLNRATLAHEGEGYVFTLTDQTQLRFNSHGNLTSETDPNGNAVTISYEEYCEKEEVRNTARPRPAPKRTATGGGCEPPRLERVVKITDAHNRSITFTYNESGHIETATDPAGHTVHYAYAGARLSSVTEPGQSGATWHFGYGASHEITTLEEALGHAQKTEYTSEQAVAQTDAAGNTTTFAYAPAGSGTEATITQPDKTTTVTVTNAFGLPVRTTSASGTAEAATTTYEYDEQANLLAVTNNREEATRYTYDADGNRTSETNPAHETTKSTYDSAHNLLSVTTPNKAVTEYKRDGHGNVTETKLTASGITPQSAKYEYAATGDLEAETNTAGKTTHYSYDEFGDRTSETDPSGNKRTYGYDGDSQGISMTAPQGNTAPGEAVAYTSTLERDAQERPVAIKSPAPARGETSARVEFIRKAGKAGTGPGEFVSPEGLAVDAEGNVWIADSKTSHVSEFGQNGEFIKQFGSKGTGAGQLSSPQGVAVDSHNNIWVVDTKNNRVQEFTHAGEFMRTVGTKGTGAGQLSVPRGVAVDTSGNIWVADTKNNRIEEFNKAGEFVRQAGGEGTAPGQMLSPDGVAVDREGNVWVADTKNSRVQKFDKVGKPLAVVGSKGTAAGQFSSPAALALDAHGNVWVADTNNDRFEEFNEQGEFMSQAGATGSKPGQLSRPQGIGLTAAGDVWVADGGNARIEEWGPGERRYVYAASGQLQSVSDASGATTRYTYNELGELTRVELPNGNTEETSYNELGQVTAHKDGNGHESHLAYNALGQIAESTDGAGRTTHRTYDAAGRLQTVTDPEGRNTSYGYNEAGQLHRITYSAGETPAVEFEYDAEGRRASMVDGSGTTTYKHDGIGRLIETKSEHGTVSYSYNAENKVSAITYPNGKSVERTFDTAGRLESVKDWLGNTTTFSYDANSNPTTITFPSATKETDLYTFSPSDEVVSATFSKGAKALASLAYTRNDSGQPVRVTQKNLPGAEATENLYDQNGRLSLAGTAEFGYDGAGNPTNFESRVNTFDSANQLTASGTTNYGYDEEGARLTGTPSAGPATSYSYNQAGELTKVTKSEGGGPPSLEVSYAYNGDGLRAARTASGTSNYYSWDTAEELPLLLADGTNSYIYGPEGLPVEQISNAGTVLYLHHDPQGSTRLLTSSSGAVSGTATYGPYGQIAESTGTGSTPLGYDGQYTDADTGLVYLRARYYDPGTAQFLTRDPNVGLGEPYNYAGGDPLHATDPSGENIITKIGEVAEELTEAALPKLIGKTEWAKRAPGWQGWTLEVSPTHICRIECWESVIRHFAWKEVKSSVWKRALKTGDVRNGPPDELSNSMYQQFWCHADNPYAMVIKPTWNLDVWRRSESLVNEELHLCNPAPWKSPKEQQ